MSASRPSSSLASPFVRNCFVLCGLWFAYGFVGIPLNWAFSRLFVEGRIFNDFSGHIGMRVLGHVMQGAVAAALGAVLPRLIDSTAQRPWAAVFALYIGCLHLLGMNPGQAFTPTDMLVEVVIAALLAGCAFLGFLFAARRLARAPTASSGLSGA